MGADANTNALLVKDEVDHLVTPEAAPPHIAPLPPWKGIMKGSSLSGGRSWHAGLDCTDVPGESAPCESREPCFWLRAKLTYWSHRLTSGAMPAAARWTGRRSYWVL